MPDPAQSGSAFELVAALQAKYGWKLFKDLKANGMIVPGPNAAALNPVLQGAKAAVFGAVDYISFGRRAKGEPVDVIFPKVRHGCRSAPGDDLEMVEASGRGEEIHRLYAVACRSSRGGESAYDACTCRCQCQASADQGSDDLQIRRGSRSMPSASRCLPNLRRSSDASKWRRSGGVQRAGPIVWIAVAGLLLVVAVPIFFVVLQAIFPKIGEGSLADPFGAFAGALDDPALLKLTANTLWLGSAVVLSAACIAVPLGVLRALFRVPLAPVWDFVFLLPFLIPPYIATLGWILTLAAARLSCAARRRERRSVLVFVLRHHLRDGVSCVSGRLFRRLAHHCSGWKPLCRRGARVRRLAVERPSCAITLPLAAPALPQASFWCSPCRSRNTARPLPSAARPDSACWSPESNRGLPTGRSTCRGQPCCRSSWSRCRWPPSWSSCASWRAAHLRQPAASRKQPSSGRLARSAIPVAGLFLLAALFGAAIPLFAIFATALSRTLSGGLSAGNLGLHNFALILRR